MYACDEISGRLKTALMKEIFTWSSITFKKVCDLLPTTSATVAQKQAKVIRRSLQCLLIEE